MHLRIHRDSPLSLLLPYFIKCVKELTIVVSNIPQNTNSVTDYKKGLIVDTLIGSDMTLAELANEIDNIIDSDVVLWNMKG